MMTVMAIIMINYTDDDVTDEDPDWALTSSNPPDIISICSHAGLKRPICRMIMMII